MNGHTRMCLHSTSVFHFCSTHTHTCIPPQPCFSSLHTHTDTHKHVHIVHVHTELTLSIFSPIFPVYTCTHTHAHILRAHIQIYNFYFYPCTSCTGPEAAQVQPCSPVISCVSTFICSLRMFTVTLRADLKYRAFPCKESRREIRKWQLIPRTNIVTLAHCQAQLGFPNSNSATARIFITSQ